MDRIALSWNDIRTIGNWGMENKKLVHSFPVPLKNLQMVIDSQWVIDVERRENKVRFSHTIDGKSYGMQVFRLGKPIKPIISNTSLQGPDRITALSTYIATMAYMVYGPVQFTKEGPRKTAVHRAGGPERAAKSVTYILHRARTGVPQGGHHRSPQGIFSVRGHYRRYKSGKTVWIAEYKKGTGQETGREYRL